MIRNNKLKMGGGVFEDVMSDDAYIICTPNPSNIYTIFIDEEIAGPLYYREALQILAMSSESDNVIFRISSDGGDISGALALANAINATEATTVAIVESHACSAATLIPMVTDEVVMKPFSYMMMHSASYNVMDEIQKVRKYVDFQHNRLFKLLHHFYDGFLTPKEIDIMVNQSGELWFDEDECMDRFKKREDAYLKSLVDMAVEEESSIDRDGSLD